ncbi:MAG: S8 family serine peptidase [Planctomycetota bacterium]
MLVTVGDYHGHGTHVAGTVGGSGVNSVLRGGTPYQWRGLAPECQFACYYYGTEIEKYQELISMYGADVTTNSFVQNVDGQYDAEAADLDGYVRGAAGRSIVIDYAAGNNGAYPQYGTIQGYFSVFTSAKNTISVGSVDSNDSNLSWFSSLGPTFDGRIKPDVMAPGCATAADWGIMSTLPGGTYAAWCGTSMACPSLTGAVALLLEAYARTTDADLDLDPPRPSTVRPAGADVNADADGCASITRRKPGKGPAFRTSPGVPGPRRVARSAPAWYEPRPRRPRTARQSMPTSVRPWMRVSQCRDHDVSCGLSRAP